jgi:hypothetical protein
MTWWQVGLVAWCVVSAPVAFVLGRSIGIADRAARPETASDAQERERR